MLRSIRSILVRAELAGALLGVICVSYPQTGAHAENMATILDLGSDANRLTAAEFDLRGRWTIVHDPTAKTGVALQYSGISATDEQLPLAIYKAAFLKNAEITIRLRVDGEPSDGAGGAAVRLSSPRDYYLVQVDARRQMIFFLRVDHGATEEIAGVDADITAHSWHTLTIRAIDDQFTVSLDGVWAFTAFDKILSQPGSIALWANGNSVTRFDQIDIAPLSAMN